MFTNTRYRPLGTSTASPPRSMQMKSWYSGSGCRASKARQIRASFSP